jgi:hypothetical protein
MENITITFKLKMEDGSEIEISEEKAREIYCKLKGIFEKTIPYYPFPNQPIYYEKDLWQNPFPYVTSTVKLESTPFHVSKQYIDIIKEVQL